MVNIQLKTVRFRGDVSHTDPLLVNVPLHIDRNVEGVSRVNPFMVQVKTTQLMVVGTYVPNKSWCLGRMSHIDRYAGDM